VPEPPALRTAQNANAASRPSAVRRQRLAVGTVWVRRGFSRFGRFGRSRWSYLAPRITAFSVSSRTLGGVPFIQEGGCFSSRIHFRQPPAGPQHQTTKTTKTTEVMRDARQRLPREPRAPSAPRSDDRNDQNDRRLSRRRTARASKSRKEPAGPGARPFFRAVVDPDRGPEAECWPPATSPARLVCRADPSARSSIVGWIRCSHITSATRCLARRPVRGMRRSGMRRILLTRYHQQAGPR
jgi:hypothetical protein